MRRSPSKEGLYWVPLKRGVVEACATSVRIHMGFRGYIGYGVPLSRSIPCVHGSLWAVIQGYRPP